jgi:hypothetical protein
VAARGLGAPHRVVERGARVVGAVVADHERWRLVASGGGRGETQLPLDGAACDDQHRAIGLVQQSM